MTERIGGIKGLIVRSTLTTAGIAAALEGCGGSNTPTFTAEPTRSPDSTIVVPTIIPSPTEIVIPSKSPNTIPTDVPTHTPPPEVTSIPIPDYKTLEKSPDNKKATFNKMKELIENGYSSAGDSAQQVLDINQMEKILTDCVEGTDPLNNCMTAVIFAQKLAQETGVITFSEGATEGYQAFSNKYGRKLINSVLNVYFVKK